MGKYIDLEVGKVYELRAGGFYKCLERLSNVGYLLRRPNDGWTCEAYGVQMNDEGKIHWNYSLGGYFSKMTNSYGREPEGEHHE